jgi:hypothetical protein
LWEQKLDNTSKITAAEKAYMRRTAKTELDRPYKEKEHIKRITEAMLDNIVI